MHVPLCLCDGPRIRTATRIVLVPHAGDWDQPSNTGRVAALSLASCELAVWARRGRVFDPALLLRDGCTHLLLHPGPDAEPIGSVRGPVRLLVPDGSWRQATGIASRLARLPGVRRVRVEPGPCPRLRRSGDPSRVGTAFAIAAALEALGEAEAARALHARAETMVHRALWVRGKIAADRVRGGVSRRSRR